jgi:hypothetical protein
MDNEQQAQLEAIIQREAHALVEKTQRHTLDQAA